MEQRTKPHPFSQKPPFIVESQQLWEDRGKKQLMWDGTGRERENSKMGYERLMSLSGFHQWERALPVPQETALHISHRYLYKETSASSWGNKCNWKIAFIFQGLWKASFRVRGRQLTMPFFPFMPNALLWLVHKSLGDPLINNFAVFIKSGREIFNFFNYCISF